MKSKNLAREWVEPKPTTPYEVWMPHSRTLMSWLNRNCKGHYFCQPPTSRSRYHDEYSVRFELQEDAMLAMIFHGGEAVHQGEKMPIDWWTECL